MPITNDLLTWDEEHLMHSLFPVGKNYGKIWEKGKGVILQDTEGKEYIDFCAELSCVNLGYGQSELVAAAAEQMQKLSYSATFYGFSNVPSIEYGKKLTELTPEGLDHIFFTAGGSESNESAYVLART